MPGPAPKGPGIAIRVKKTFFILAVIALCVPLLRAADEAPVRVFVLKYRRVEEAALLVRPLLSESASVTLTQKLNAMTVTDRPEKLDQIGKVIAAFDVPPRTYSIAVKLVKARAEVPAGSIAPEIGSIGAKLKSLFPFNDYALIDSAVQRGTEGRILRYQLGSEYMLSFAILSSSGSNEILLSAFTLSKLWTAKPGQPGLMQPLFRTSVPVTLSQTLVLGASKDEASRSALILVLLPEEVPVAAAEKGTDGARAAEKRP